MRKIPTVFVRDPENMSRVTDQVNPGCEWVLQGHGRATRKWDGTCVKVEGGVMWKRREVKKGKPVPDGFVEEDHDLTTGKRQGWMLVGDGPDDAIHREALAVQPWPDGTYELLGPKVQGNPDDWPIHSLTLHGGRGLDLWPDGPPTLAGIRAYLEATEIEGIVWHHADGRTAKIKRRDFGIPWPVR